MERINRVGFKIKSNHLTNYLYQGLLGIFIFHRILTSTYLRNVLGVDINIWTEVIQWGFPFLLLALFFLEAVGMRISMRKFGLSIALLFVLIINFIAVRNTTLIISFLFIIVFPDEMEIKRLAKFISNIYFLTIVLILLLCYIGVIEDYMIGRSGLVIERHSMGFVSPNAFGNTVAIACLIYTYALIDRWKIKNTLFVLIVGIMTYSMSDSRMAGLVMLGLAGLGTFYELLRKLKFFNVFYYITAYLFPVFTAGFIALASFMSRNSGSASYIALNMLLSNRVRWMVYYLDQYGVSLLGNRIGTVSIYQVATQGGTWMGLDNSYLMIAIQFGLVFSIVFTIGYYMLGRRLKEKKDLAGAILATVFLMMGISENYLFGINYNLTLLMFAYEFYVRNRFPVSQKGKAYRIYTRT